MVGIPNETTGALMVVLAGEPMWLLPERAIWWPGQQALFIADLHLGKAAHFRKAGLAIPSGVDSNDLQRLEKLVALYLPLEVFFLGDLFHSEHNPSWEAFLQVIHRWPACLFHLIKGNHDILQGDFYRDSGITIWEGVLRRGPFSLVHDPDEAPLDGGYALAGHWHPGYRLRGKGRQSLRLPCFLLESKRGVLPAFGGFTGTRIVDPGPADRVVAVAGDRLVWVHGEGGAEI